MVYTVPNLKKKLFQIEPVLSPEDKPSFSQEINKEKTLVEIFLRKYGFGHWQLPHDVSKILLKMMTVKYLVKFHHFRMVWSKAAFHLNFGT